MGVQKSIYERSVSEEWKLYQSPIGQMLTQRKMAKKVSRSRTSPSVPESATDDRAEIPNPEHVTAWSSVISSRALHPLTHLLDNSTPSHYTYLLTCGQLYSVSHYIYFLILWKTSLHILLSYSTMKVDVTQEEYEAFDRATIRGSVEGIAAGLAISLPASFAAQRFLPAYRALPIHLKALGVVLIVGPTWAIQTERRGVEFDEQHNW